MPVDLTPLATQHRLLFSIPLRPAQGHRFQPTGFPSLGAATFQTAQGTSLLVESAQSMANRLETAVWDEATQRPVDALAGLSHVTVRRGEDFLTDTMLEAHRLNSPYLLEGSNKSFMETLKDEMSNLGDGPIDRRRLAEVLLKYDANSLLHGVFLAKKELAGGRLRVTRALSAFVEADGVRVAPAGGVKNDHVNPSGDTKAGYGNVPFARDEFTAEKITLYVSFDLALLRGYGLGEAVERMLILLGLYKLRAMLDRGLRFRTACDLDVATDAVVADRPAGFALPALAPIEGDLRAAIAAVAPQMKHTVTQYEDDLKKSKDGES